jgi:hypothetical protein
MINNSSDDICIWISMDICILIYGSFSLSMWIPISLSASVTLVRWDFHPTERPGFFLLVQLKRNSDPGYLARRRIRLTESGFVLYGQLCRAAVKWEDSDSGAWDRLLGGPFHNGVDIRRTKYGIWSIGPPSFLRMRLTSPLSPIICENVIEWTLDHGNRQILCVLDNALCSIGGKKVVSPIPSLWILTTSKKLWYHPKLNIK